jgi:hypothetical protein
LSPALLALVGMLGSFLPQAIAQECVSAPCTVSGNFPRDLYGPIDLRMPGLSCNVGPCIWGHADSDSLTIHFHPPAGYAVHILRLRGDLISWPKVLGDQPPVGDSRDAGVLVGFSTSSPVAASACDFAAEGVFLYIQDAIHGGGARRAPFDYDYSRESIYLGSDSAMLVKLAVFLNSTGYPIHEEVTYTVTARFEQIPGA